MSKRVLVTGGAGFIGTNLCKKLVEKKYEVICIDNLFSGQKSNITELLDNNYFEFIRHDITEPILLEVDEIYHLACPASPIHYQFNPVKTIKTNVIGTINMLGLAKRIKSKILLSSTSEIYGQPKEHPQKENYWGNVNPIGIRSCYDEGKRVAETLMMDYHRQNKVDIRIVRIFNTYGPHLHPKDGRVISNFIIQALNNKPITLYGDGNQTRSFCYIDDMVDGLIKMMEQDGFIGPVNLGNPEEITILELAEKIENILNKKSNFEFKPLPKDDPMRRKPDISLANEKLKWKPITSLQEGLIKTINYFKKINNSANDRDNQV